MFLSDEEMEKLTGYKPNQRKRMCRWLEKNGYPYNVNRLGAPVVFRSLLDEDLKPIKVDPGYMPRIRKRKAQKSNIEKWHDKCREEARLGIVRIVKPTRVSPGLEKSIGVRSYTAPCPAPTETEYHRYRRQATPRALSFEHRQQMRQMYNKTRGTKKRAGENLSVDHIVPLRGDGVCGLHVPWNLRIVPLLDNQRKNNRLVECK